MQFLLPILVVLTGVLGFLAGYLVCYSRNRFHNNSGGD